LRYSEDFVIGYVGSKAEASEMLRNVIRYLYTYLNVDINVKKTRLKHRSEGILFLGYQIEGIYVRGTDRPSVQRRGGSRQLRVKVPVTLLIAVYKDRGFLKMAKLGKNKERVVARRVDKWLFLPSDLEVVSRYQRIVNGLLIYYVSCYRCSSLYEVLRLLKRSCALTLAHRHKLRSAKKAFAR
jgi:hypothetical protein